MNCADFWNTTFLQYYSSRHLNVPHMELWGGIWFEPSVKPFSQIFPSACRDYTLVIRRVGQPEPSAPMSLQMTSCSNNAISVVSNLRSPGSFSLGLTQLCIYQCNCQELEALILSIRRISILLRAEGLLMYGPLECTATQLHAGQRWSGLMMLMTAMVLMISDHTALL